MTARATARAASRVQSGVAGRLRDSIELGLAQLTITDRDLPAEVEEIRAAERGRTGRAVATDVRVYLYVRDERSRPTHDDPRRTQPLARHADEFGRLVVAQLEPVRHRQIEQSTDW